MTAGRCEGATAEEAVPSLRHRPSICFCLGGSWVIRGLGELYAVAHRGEVLQAMPSMDWDDYLRTEAAMYRQLAEEAENSFGKQELLDLAAVCEEVANSIEDRLTGG
jgi:hypothetical protein